MAAAGDERAVRHGQSVGDDDAGEDGGKAAGSRGALPQHAHHESRHHAGDEFALMGDHVFHERLVGVRIENEHGQARRTDHDNADDNAPQLHQILLGGFRVHEPLVAVKGHESRGGIHHRIHAGENRADQSRRHQPHQPRQGQRGNDLAQQHRESGVGCQLHSGQFLLKQIIRGDAGADGDEGDQQLEEAGGDDARAGVFERAGGEGALHDELVRAPIINVQHEQAREHAGPWKARIIHRLV